MTKATTKKRATTKPASKKVVAENETPSTVPTQVAAAQAAAEAAEAKAAAAQAAAEAAEAKAAAAEAVAKAAEEARAANAAQVTMKAKAAAPKAQEASPRRQKRLLETFTNEGEPMTLIQTSHYLRTEDVYILDSIRAEIRRATEDSGVDVSAILRGTISVLDILRQAPKESPEKMIWQKVLSETQRLRNKKRPGRWG